MICPEFFSCNHLYSPTNTGCRPRLEMISHECQNSYISAWILWTTSAKCLAAEQPSGWDPAKLQAHLPSLMAFSSKTREKSISQTRACALTWNKRLQGLLLSSSHFPILWVSWKQHHLGKETANTSTSCTACLFQSGTVTCLLVEKWEKYWWSPGKKRGLQFWGA